MDVRVVKISESSKLGEDLSFVRTRIVQYMIGEQGPFQIELDAKDFDAGRVRALLEEQAQQIRGLMGGG